MTVEYTAEMAHAAVERGAAWLDEQCPQWASLIDLDELDLKDAYHCVLGQTYTCIPAAKPRQGIDNDSGYWSVLHGLGVEFEVVWAGERGFDAPGGPGADKSDTAYEMLTIAWHELIRGRQWAAS